MIEKYLLVFRENVQLENGVKSARQSLNVAAFEGNNQTVKDGFRYLLHSVCEFIFAWGFGFMPHCGDLFLFLLHIFFAGSLAVAPASITALFCSTQRKGDYSDL